MSIQEFSAMRIQMIDEFVVKPMEILSRYVYEKASSEMGKELSKAKSEAFNEILKNRGELARVMAERDPSIEKAIELYREEVLRLCNNVMEVIKKMLTEIDGEIKERKTEQEAAIPDLWRMEKTYGQKAADARLCSIDKNITKSLERMTRKMFKKAPIDSAKLFSDMKIQTLNEILIKRAEATRAVDKGLEEGVYCNAVSWYSAETTVLLDKLMNVGTEMLAGFKEERRKDDRNLDEIIRQQMEPYKQKKRAEIERVDKILKEDPNADVEKELVDLQERLFKINKKAWKAVKGVVKQNDLVEKEAEKKVTVEEEAEKKEKVTVEKEEEKKEKVTVEEEAEKKEKVPSTDELKNMMTVMKEDLLQEFNKKLESAHEEHKKEIEEVQKDYCRLEAEKNEEMKRLTVVVESLNKKLEAMTMEMAEKQKKTEFELKGVKRELKEATEELEKMQEDSEDSSFDQLDDHYE
uniref:DUF1351 domain-containing protein n=1 Tax=Caenorhabditis tropicalis TaxID=1561998 RepID=A0A1I7UHC7_9PELO